MLLKSCATPPARRPMDSIFCACCNCACNVDLSSSVSHRLCDRWSSGGPAEETAEWMAVTRARSASQPGAGADSSTPNPGKPFGTRSPLYRCWPHRLSTSGGNDAGVLRKLGPQKPKAPPVATLFLRWSSAAPAVSRVEARLSPSSASSVHDPTQEKIRATFRYRRSSFPSPVYRCVEEAISGVVRRVQAERHKH